MHFGNGRIATAVACAGLSEMGREPYAGSAARWISRDGTRGLRHRKPKVVGPQGTENEHDLVLLCDAGVGSVLDREVEDVVEAGEAGAENFSPVQRFGLCALCRE